MKSAAIMRRGNRTAGDASTMAGSLEGVSLIVAYQTGFPVAVTKQVPRRTNPNATYSLAGPFVNKGFPCVGCGKNRIDGCLPLPRFLDSAAQVGVMIGVFLKARCTFGFLRRHKAFTHFARGC